MLLIHSYRWNLSDDNEMDHNTTDCVAHLAWKSKDFKARDDILLHCGKKINFLLDLLPHPKLCGRLKQLYQHSNKAFQVNLHKKLFQLSTLDYDDVVDFLES
jgi:hypothetical protein